MKIIPSIDLINGQCVRLQQGQFDKVTQYTADPIQLALTYQQQGARDCHIVDLDAARDVTLAQFSLIEKIAKHSELDLQVGGGIRKKQQLTDYFNAGIKKMVIGSKAVTDPETVLDWLQQFGAEKIVLALDIQYQQSQPIVKTHAWQNNSNQSLWQVLDNYPQIQQVLCTDIACDGLLQGPNFSLYQQAIQRYPTIAWQASGGIRHQQDCQQLQQAGLAAAIIGKALYAKTINLSEVLSC